MSEMAALAGGEQAAADTAAACGMLQRAHRVRILCHAAPDGDTIGSAFALGRALQDAGKQIRIDCADPIPLKYDYIRRNLEFSDFTPDLTVATDVASEALLGEAMAECRGRVDLCIDHHPSNTRYAGFTLLRPAAAATCEIMAGVIGRMGIPVSREIADCLYTGIATDTGCFRYSNTRPSTLRLAARLIELGADSAGINKRMFETVSRQWLALELAVLASMRFHMAGQVAVLAITQAMLQQTGVAESETEGIPALAARIAGVRVGITLKEKADGRIKVSVRTGGGINASGICARLGGGGHANAAGCAFTGLTMEQAHDAVLAAVKEEMAGAEPDRK